ncbi:hypothetical protein [Fictibacillus sp. BK138]|uniref:hypothetical protein n=1 Tax=Fictibacillus sp. BK138 TaxID=2512121 RepID=UPI00102A852B|nr:hypothetical protein [Fictibacillus sp. BK138]RZT23592.1 hypothetical protein EV282_2685 [Fictibacillus sp. BK138]
MKNRSKDYYRHHRNRVIQKKLNVIKNVWCRDETIPHPYEVDPGKLSKGKLHCSCYMCKYEKHEGIVKSKFRSKLDLMKKDIEDM